MYVISNNLQVISGLLINKIENWNIKLTNILINYD